VDLSVRTFSDVELVVDAKNILGEGVIWCARRRRVYWTDIESSLLWEYDPDTRHARTWKTPRRVGSLVSCHSERLLIALEKQIAYFDLEDGSIEPLADFELDIQETRANDGRCDRSGNFVFGTLNDRFDGRALGSFYQYHPRHGLRRLALGNVRINNSICFSPDGGTMYYCDTPTREIRCCDYDAESARVSNDRLFAMCDSPATPDGSIIDAEGYLWNAQWAGARIVRYSPRGEIDAIVRLPTPNPTCIAFGGDRFDELYITTSRQQMSIELLRIIPDAGGLYRVRLPMVGTADDVFNDRRANAPRGIADAQDRV
jgi:L-arabinonolactonase